VEATSQTTERVQFLTFFIGREEYAVSIRRTKEIIGYPPVTRVPGTPAFIRGVLNLRGSVVPVVDLAVKLGLPELDVTNRTCVVIVEVELEEEPVVMGIVADAVSQVVELAPDEIAEPPSFGTDVRVEYLLGMGRAGQRFVLMLDIDRVLSERELLAVTGLDPEEGGDDAATPDLVAADVETTSEPTAGVETAAGSARASRRSGRRKPAASAAGSEADARPSADREAPESVEAAVPGDGAIG